MPCEPLQLVAGEPGGARDRGAERRVDDRLGHGAAREVDAGPRDQRVRLEIARADRPRFGERFVEQRERVVVLAALAGARSRVDQAIRAAPTRTRAREQRECLVERRTGLRVEPDLEQHDRRRR